MQKSCCFTHGQRYSPEKNFQVQGHQVEVKGHWYLKRVKGTTTPCVESACAKKKLLLYTGAEIQPRQNFQVQGHQIEVKGHWCLKMSKGITRHHGESMYEK
jgi:hypothetical protein